MDCSLLGSSVHGIFQARVLEWGAIAFSVHIIIIWERYKHLNAEFQRTARRDKKAFLSEQCKEIEENKEWERLEISSRKLEIPREHFMQI